MFSSTPHRSEQDLWHRVSARLKGEHPQIGRGFVKSDEPHSAAKRFGVDLRQPATVLLFRNRQVSAALGLCPGVLAGAEAGACALQMYTFEGWGQPDPAAALVSFCAADPPREPGQEVPPDNSMKTIGEVCMARSGGC